MQYFILATIKIEMEMMSLPLETRYKCKICDGYIFGYYVWMEQKMYFRGVCKC